MSLWLHGSWVGPLPLAECVPCIFSFELALGVFIRVRLVARLPTLIFWPVGFLAPGSLVTLSITASTLLLHIRRFVFPCSRRLRYRCSTLRRFAFLRSHRSDPTPPRRCVAVGGFALRRSFASPQYYFSSF
jgi:hypothetical protein